jgi:hypothetical protein
MIVFTEDGRLGNQFFQLNYILKIRKKNEKVILIGFDSLNKIIKKNSYITHISKNKIFAKVLIKYRYNLNKYFIILKICSVIFEDHKENITFQKGFFHNIRFVSGFFQNPKFISSSFIQLINRNTVFEKIAKKKILHIKKNYNKICFIHYRITDFINWPNKKYPAIVPVKWFVKCSKKLKKKNKIFIVFTDSPSQFKKKNNFKFTVVKNSELIDFFMMIHCDEAILSPSTFGWWAAYILKKHKKKATIIAPNYWAGHRIRKFYPKFLVHPDFKYKNVTYRDYQ